MRTVLFSILSLFDTQIFMNFFAIVAIVGSIVVAYNLFSFRRK